MNTKQNISTIRKLREENTYERNLTYYVVSLAEFIQMKEEKYPDVEGLSYEEYCAIESECWDEMFKVQMMAPWERPLTPC